MNGELFQICMLVNAARKAMRNKQEFKYENDEYVNLTKFVFLPAKIIFRKESYIAYNANDWFQYCVKHNIVDMKMLAPITVENRNVLGFSNTGQASVVTFYKNGRVTYWVSKWEFDQTKKQWDVVYQENQWENPPSGKPCFANNKEAFKDILKRIAKFADEINCRNFGDVFREANDFLNGQKEIPVTYKNGKKMYLPDLPDEKKRMFLASSTADVFGAMGSWNDEPPYYAHEKGLEQEYEQLSNELLQQIRSAMLYAINED